MTTKYKGSNHYLMVHNDNRFCFIFNIFIILAAFLKLAKLATENYHPLLIIDQIFIILCSVKYNRSLKKYFSNTSETQTVKKNLGPLLNFHNYNFNILVLKLKIGHSVCIDTLTNIKQLFQLFSNSFYKATPSFPNETVT